MTDAVCSGAPGPRNDLTDVAGVGVGHATHPDKPTGATVIAAPGFCAAGVDQRGLAPATRETDALKPSNSVGGLHAIALSGASALGLAAGSGAAEALARAGVGLRVTPNAVPVPIVPAAAVYDLDALGPDFLSSPGSLMAGLGRIAAQRALAAADGGAAPVDQGLVGAGRGARAAGGRGGAIPGGLGMASWRFSGGPTVAALIVANPVGSPYMPDERTFWAWPFEIDGEFGGARPDARSAADVSAPATKLGPGAPALNTVIGCVATDADLSAIEATQLAQMAQAGVARAVRPANTPFDGDTLFAFATAAEPLAPDVVGRPARLLSLGAHAADCVARALSRAVHISNSVGRLAPGDAG